MSDVSQDWQETPVRRKGPPKWMIFTGCGCLLPGFFLAALLAWAMQYFGDSTSPRAAYESLARTLPYDEALKGRATGLADDPSTRVLESHESPEFQLMFGNEIPFSGGVSIHYLVRGASLVDGETVFADDALVAIIAKVPSEQSDEVMESQVEHDEGEPFEIDVQGVTLSGLRLTSIESKGISEIPLGTTEVSGPGVSLKLRSGVAQDPDDPDSKLFDVMLILQRPEESAPPVTDEDIQHFLAPFHIGPAR